MRAIRQKFWSIEIPACYQNFQVAQQCRIKAELVGDTSGITNDLDRILENRR